MNGILGNYNLFNTRFQSVARCGTDRYSSVTLNLCNRSELETCYVDIAVTTTENVIDNNSRYIEYNAKVAPNTSFKRDGILLSQGEFLTLVYRGEDPRCLTATVWGIESGEDQGLVAIAENLDPSPVIVTTSLPNAEEGLAYEQQIVATDNRAVATYTVISGSLPSGLTLNSATGVISGTPDVTGNAQQDFTFTVRVTDIVDEFTDQELTITRTPDTTPPVWITDAVTGLVIDQAFSYQLVADDVGDISYSVTNGSLPSGLVVNNEGLLVGTPTIGGAFTFTVTATNSAGLSADQTFNVNVRNFTATGGTVTDIDLGGTTYRIHAFTDVGDDSFTVSGDGDVDLLVVGAGGGGGETIGGGGGAGEVLYLTGVNLITDSYSVTVGAGGVGGQTGVTGGGSYPGGDSGDASVFNIYTADGGGAGGGYNESGIGTGGGHGGGQGAGGGAGVAPGTGLNAGGSSGTNNNSGAGGGGADSVGSNSSSGSPGTGGNGTDLSAYFGTLFGDQGYFAAGGGGGARSPSGGTGADGGIGGGGKGGTGAQAGFAGTPNTGSGGGGGGYRNSPVFQGNGGAGASGIVLVRYEL